MTVAATQGPDGASANHLVLYDGVCGLCNRLLQFLLTHDRRGVFCFAALQSHAGMSVVEKWGGDPEDLTSFYVLADFRTPNARALTKSDAAVFVAGELGWPWKALWLAGALPKGLRNRIYDMIARSRYRLFGRFDQCLLPRPEFRSRFIE